MRLFRLCVCVSVSRAGYYPRARFLKSVCENKSNFQHCSAVVVFLRAPNAPNACGVYRGNGHFTRPGIRLACLSITVAQFCCNNTQTRWGRNTTTHVRRKRGNLFPSISKTTFLPGKQNARGCVVNVRSTGLDGKQQTRAAFRRRAGSGTDRNVGRGNNIRRV